MDKHRVSVTRTRSRSKTHELHQRVRRTALSQTLTDSRSRPTHIVLSMILIGGKIHMVDPDAVRILLDGQKL